MSFRRPLCPLFVVLLGALAAVASARAQQFPQPTVIPTIAVPYSAATVWATTVLHGDFDGDGKEDLLYQYPGPATGVYAGYVFSSVLFGNGDGTFAAPYGSAEFTSGHVPIETVAVLNPGGRASQISLQGTASDVSVAEIGVIPFTTSRMDDAAAQRASTFAVTGSSFTNFTCLTAADINGDGAKDLIAEDSANNVVYVLLNDGTNTFTLKAQYALSAADGTGPIIAGDFNGDGKIDFLINNQTSHVITPYYGNGDGTFTAGPQFTLPGGIFSMLVGDIDGDGIPDLVVEGANGALSYFPGSATGFSPNSLPLTNAQDGTTGNGGHLVAIADLNGDHVSDIITSTPAGISVLLGQPPLTPHVPYTPTYTLLGIYDAGPGRTSYALADFNGDGHLDLAIDSPEGVAILFGNPDGSFQTSRSYAAGLPADGLALGQFSASGNVDAIVADGTPELFLGDGKGGFAESSSPIPAPNHIDLGANGWWSVGAGDFNGDGHLDALFLSAGAPSPLFVVVSPASGGTTTSAFPPYTGIDFGDGTGAFPNFALVTGYVSGYASAVADFNGDGVSDLASFDQNGCTVHLGPSLSFNPVTIAADPAGAAYNVGAVGFLTAGRTNKQDLVCQLSTGIQVFRNNGDGTFTQTATLGSPGGFAVADKNGVFPSTGMFPSALLLADLDGDGFGDIVVLYHNLAADPAHPDPTIYNELYVYWGNGDGTFSSTPTIDIPSRNYFEAAVANIAGTPNLILSDGYLLGVLTLTKTSSTARVSGETSNGVHPFGRVFKSPELHYLAGMGINGISTTTLNGNTAIVLANGGAVLSSPAFNRGTLASNAEVNTGGITVLAPVPALTTVTGTLTASPEPSPYNQGFTLTAILIPPGTGAPATGTVTFSIAGTVVGTSSLTNGVATFDIPAETYTPGTYALTAVYSGDTNYATTTLTGSHAVALQPSMTFLTLLASPIHYGEVIGDTAVANATDLNFVPVTGGGTITVFVDGKSMCVLSVGATARCPNTTGAGFMVGPHTTYLVFSGNAIFASSTSVTYTVIILADDTLGTVVSSSNPSVVGNPVTFTATFTAASYPPTGLVPSPFATPTGTVTFLDGATVIGTGTLDPTGTATLTTSTLALGTHPITASYAATANFNGSTTAVLQQMIVQPAAQTATILGSSVNPSTLGQNVTFTASLAITSMQTGPSGGTITFTIDGATVATVTLSSTQGSASFSISTLALGSHNVIASYSGIPGAFDPSTSSTLVQVVDPMPAAPSFTMTVTPAALSVPIGNSATTVVTITALNGFSQAVTLSCSGLPREATCAFGATTLPAGGGTTQLSVTASAPHDCDNNTPYFVTPSGPTTWLGLLATGGLIVLLRRRRGLLKGIALALALCVLPALAGCGHCTDLGVPPGNYTFTVTGTSTGSPSTAISQTVQMVAHL